MDKTQNRNIKKDTFIMLLGIAVIVFIAIGLILGFMIKKVDEVAVNDFRTYEKCLGIIDTYKQASKQLEDGKSVTAVELKDIMDELNENAIEPTKNLNKDVSQEDIREVVDSLFESISGDMKELNFNFNYDLVKQASEGGGVAELSSQFLNDDRLMSVYMVSTANARSDIKGNVEEILAKVQVHLLSDERYIELQKNAQQKPVIIYYLEKFKGN